MFAYFLRAGKLPLNLPRAFPEALESSINSQKSGLTQLNQAVLLNFPNNTTVMGTLSIKKIKLDFLPVL
jgi:hypothetical protein